MKVLVCYKRAANYDVRIQVQPGALSNRGVETRGLLRKTQCVPPVNVSSELQAGQTGKLIAPQLSLAIGIQHPIGIKDAATTAAINQDPENSIFEIADIGLVGRLSKLLPEPEAPL